SVQFSADTLARIPEQQRGKACVCRSCAEVCR
ncbi:MAG: cysteine-rich CWC family protein, partial [Burkholderiales bacterium]